MRIMHVHDPDYERLAFVAALRGGNLLEWNGGMGDIPPSRLAFWRAWRKVLRDVSRLHALSVEVGWD